MVGASIIVSIFLTFCHHYVSDILPQEKKSHSDAFFKKEILIGWSLVFVATIHLTFLPSVLPRILEGFQLMGDVALKSAGFIIMSYTFAAISGNYLLSRLSSKIGLIKVITIACISGACFQVLLILSGGVLSFMVIRMIQMGFIAAVFPLTISIFARDAAGRTIGFLNSSRFAGSAVGPLMATSVLAYSNLLTLYIAIAGFTLVTLWTFLASKKTIET